MENAGNNVSISGVHVNLTDALKSSVNSKVQKLFNHSNKIMRINVNLEFDSNRSKSLEFVAHGQVEVNGVKLTARAASDDLYKSIDQMVDKLDRQLTEKPRFSKNHDKNIVITGAASTILESR